VETLLLFGAYLICCCTSHSTL